MTKKRITPGVVTVKEYSTFCRINGASIYVQFSQPSMKEFQAPDRRNLEPSSSSKPKLFHSPRSGCRGRNGCRSETLQLVLDPDPGSDSFFFDPWIQDQDPGSGMTKNLGPDPGWEKIWIREEHPMIPVHFSESLETVFWVKNT
jgi:hypothetical protein